MLRHCVFLRFRSEIDAAQKAALYADLAALESVVPGFLGMSAGPNVSPEGKDQGFADGFVMDFADAAARDAYLVHPDHKAAGARLTAALDGGSAGLVVFDMEI
jgi:hypothetical protein